VLSLASAYCIDPFAVLRFISSEIARTSLMSSSCPECSFAVLRALVSQNRAGKHETVCPKWIAMSGVGEPECELVIHTFASISGLIVAASSKPIAQHQDSPDLDIVCQL
jgi:hypothetical protein